MRKRFLIVVDMQNDFVSGSLGTLEARAIVPQLIEKIQSFTGTVIYTMDTHNLNYLETQEGILLPVEHCIKDSVGWQLIPELAALCQESGSKIYQKNTFGSIELADDLRRLQHSVAIDSIELVGVCTDICVISNALLLKAYLPEVEIIVDGRCCAGVMPEKHRQALAVMQSCQIKVREDDGFINDAI